MTITIALLSHEQREDVDGDCADFTCRGPRHEDDETTAFGDSFIRDGLWAAADEAGIARTWVAVVGGRIAGYIALAADAVQLTNREKREAEIHERVSFRRYGCTQITMLATRAEMQERQDLRVGRALVDHAVLVGRGNGSNVGSRFLAADVNPTAVGFYERCGFVSLRGTSHDLARKRESGLVPMVYDLHPRA